MSSYENLRFQPGDLVNWFLTQKTERSCGLVISVDDLIITGDMERRNGVQVLWCTGELKWHLQVFLVLFLRKNQKRV